MATIIAGKTVRHAVWISDSHSASKLTQFLVGVEDGAPDDKLLTVGAPSGMADWGPNETDRALDAASQMQTDRPSDGRVGDVEWPRLVQLGVQLHAAVCAAWDKEHPRVGSRARRWLMER